jgi:Gram-negative porin
MKNIFASHRIRGPWVAGALVPLLAAPAMAVDLATADGKWTFSIDGNVNADYVYSNCASPTVTPTHDAGAIAGGGGLVCVGSANGNGVSSVDNGLLPAAFVFGVATTQDGIDIAAHLGVYPGIDTHSGGNPNGGGTNDALGTAGLDVRQVYATFGNKDMGTFLIGRQIGLFGADVILNDMTLLGVGGPGGAASAAPGNTTLGGIGFGYIYTDWLAQIDYTTPDFSGFNVTAGIFNPINSLTNADATEPKKAPGFHAKAAWTLPIADATKLYLSATIITQQQDYLSTTLGQYSYTGTGFDVFGKFDLQDLELVGYYYHGTGLGTTGLFAYSDDGFGNKRDSDGYFAQITYKFGPLKVGANYGDSLLDSANAADAAANGGYLVRSNRKATGGLYYSLTKNLTLLAEYSNVRSAAQNGDAATANTFNIGAFVGF